MGAYNTELITTHGIVLSVVLYCQAFASPVMGHWGTCPLDFQLFNFSGHFRAEQTPFDSMWFPIQKNMQALSLFIA